MSPEFRALNVPRHLAFVLDAPHHADAANAQTGAAGGLEALRDTLSGCREYGVRWLSILLPTPENGTTAACECLLAALRQYVHCEAPALAAHGVRLAPFNNGAEPAAHALVRALEDAQRQPVAAEVLQLRLGVACGGRADLAGAVRRLAGETAAGTLRPSEITSERLQAHLFSNDLPPVDLLVRTGGVARISDFLLWQAGYAELFFADVSWCEFRAAHLRAALADYARRRRTFGALPR